MAEAAPEGSGKRGHVGRCWGGWGGLQRLWGMHSRGREMGLGRPSLVVEVSGVGVTQLEEEVGGEPWRPR